MSYLVKVQNFFLKNDPERYYLAKKITRTFRGDEDAVMARLEEIYAKGGPKKLKVKDLSPPVNKHISSNDNLEEIESVLESNSEDLTPKKSKKKLFIVVGLILSLCGTGFGFYLTMSGEESHEEESHSSEVHALDSTHNENSNQPPKTIEEIENKIDQAEKDSVAKDLIEAGEILEILH